MTYATGVQVTQTYATAAGCNREESLALVRIYFPNHPKSVLLVTLTAAVGAGRVALATRNSLNATLRRSDRDWGASAPQGPHAVQFGAGRRRLAAHMHTFHSNLPAATGIAQPVLILNLSDVTAYHAPGSFKIRKGEKAVRSRSARFSVTFRTRLRSKRTLGVTQVGDRR